MVLWGGRQRSLLVPSVATTLGLARVSERTFALVQEHPVFSEVVTDQDAVVAVERFIGETRNPPPALHA